MEEIERVERSFSKRSRMETLEVTILMTMIWYFLVQVSLFCTIFPSSITKVLIDVGGKKGKGKKPDFSGAFSQSLQSQWEKDRSKKGDYKKARALARAEEFSQSPHLSKKSPKPPLSIGPNDASTLNIQIKHFLSVDIGKKSLSLPAMSKKSRVAVHLLAELYGLKSKSLGKGKDRFPVLERTSRSAVAGVDERRVRAIIGTAAGERFEGGGGGGGGKARGKMGGLWAALSSDGKKSGRAGGGSGGGGGGGGGANRNREGEVVGKGADRLVSYSFPYIMTLNSLAALSRVRIILDSLFYERWDGQKELKLEYQGEWLNLLPLELRW